MLAAHPAVFTPGFEPLDMPGLTPAHKMRFLEATFEWPRASDGPAAWRAWRAALTPPVSGLRVDRKELGAKMVAGKSVAGFKLRPYVLAPGSDGGGGGGGASKGAPLGGGGGNHTAMVGLDPAAVRDVLQRFNVSVLLTLRRNTLKEALSWYKARELNISQFNALRAARAAGAGGSVGSGSGSSDAQRAVSALASSHDKVTIDIPRLRGWLSYTARVNSQLRQAVGYFNRPTLTVWYEDFERDALREATHAAEFVGVPLVAGSGSGSGAGSGLELSAKFQKAGPDAIQDWVDNYEELCHALEGGPYYQHLDAAACPPPVKAATGGASTGDAAGAQPARQPADVQHALRLQPPPLLGNWCLPADKQASGWAAISDAACMQRAAAAQEAAVSEVRAGRGTVLFKHVHKAGGSTLCRLALQNMRAESPKLPNRSDWDTNCVPFEAFLGPHPAVCGGARLLAAAAAGPAAAGDRRSSAGPPLGRRLQANYLGGACWLGFLTPPQLRSLQRHYAPLNFVASEGPLPDAVPLDVPGLAWVTMLRRPADRVLSSFRWWQLIMQRWPQSPAECHAYSAPDNATLEEWLDAYPDNWMTRELVGRSVLYDRRPLAAADLRAAQARLHLFAAVLVLERPQASMALLRARFGWQETGWAEHRAGSAADSDAAAELPPELLARLRQRNQLDEQLYDYAVALHEAQAARWLAGGGGGGSVKSA